MTDNFAITRSINYTPTVFGLHEYQKHMCVYIVDVHFNSWRWGRDGREGGIGFLILCTHDRVLCCVVDFTNGFKTLERVILSSLTHSTPLTGMIMD